LDNAIVPIGIHASILYHLSHLRSNKMSRHLRADRAAIGVIQGLRTFVRR